LSVLEPPDDEDPIDAEIVEDSADADILAGLEAQLADIDTDTSGVEDVRSLEPQELLRRFAAVERELREVGQMMHQDTQEGRDLHSRRTAYMVELKRRKMR
jgi:hypothetical protein